MTTLARALVGLAVLPLAASVVGGCPNAPTWTIQFRSAADRAATVRVDARVRVGGCDGAVAFRTDVSRDDPGMPAPRLDGGVYGVEALAVDATCRVVARACELVTLPTTESVLLELDTVAPTALCAPAACVAGSCEVDAGAPPDGGPEDGGPGDGGPDGGPRDGGLDAGTDGAGPDAGGDASLDAYVLPDAFEPPDAFVGPDAWLPAPPQVLSPWNGVPTGTWRPVGGDLADPPRRPLVRWRESPGALSYVLEMVACDEHDLSLCDFSVPAARVVVDDLTFEARPATDLEVDTVAPGGRRYAFRVGACGMATGLGCAFAPTRYLDVGRQVADVDGDGIGEMVVTRTSTVEAHRGTGTAPSAILTIASGSTLGAVAYAGDVDADGRPDVVLDLGGPTGRWEVRAVDGTVLAGEDGAAATDLLARVVAGVGDVDGDGFADFAVGAPGLGEVRVQLGGSPVDPTERVVIGTDGSLETLGLDLSTAGDRDLDGLADVVIASRVSVGMVRVEVFSLAGRVARRIESFELPSGETDPSTGPVPARVAGGYDLDGDARPEICVGLPMRSAVEFLLGDGTTGTHLERGQQGHAVAMGDLAGSGVARAVVGAPLYTQPTWGQTGAYSHLSYFGSPFATYILIINREAWGTHVTAADLDGDGRDDMITFGATGQVGHSGTFRDGMVGAGANFRYLFGNGVRHLAR
jgi:hypothetical protein